MSNTYEKSSDRFSIHVYELIFCIYFAVMFGARAIGLYEGLFVYNISLVAGLILFGLKILSTRLYLGEYLICFFLVGLSLLVYVNTGEKGLRLYFSLMLSMKMIDSKKVFRLGLYILGLSFFILFFLSASGLINELNHMNKRSGFGYVLRHSLGYPYPNTAHTTLLILIIFFFYLFEYKDAKSLIKASSFAMVINVLIYLYTVSLTGLISITIYLILNIYFCLRSNKSYIEKAIINLCFPIIVSFSILGPILAKGEAFDFLNDLLHKRYEYALYYLQNEKITLLGSKFKVPPTNWYMIDNSFLYLFLQLGIIPFILIAALYILWIFYLVKENNIGTKIFN